MKKFMFYSNDGYTQDLDGNDIDNSQILGWGEGINLTEAFKNFKQEHNYLTDFNFNNIIAVEILNETLIQEDFILL